MDGPVLMCWSGGKDSALALHCLLEEGRRVSALLTTVTEDYDRISMHGVRSCLLQAQAESLGIPLERVLIPGDCPHEVYAERMVEALRRQIQTGVRQAAFGDVFLEDVRQYRVDNLSVVGMTAVFPLWAQDTGDLARRFIELGFRAIITCVDSQKLDGAFAGRQYDRQFLADLPDGADPCGENGEFHSFVYAGPIFRKPVACAVGEVVVREERFWFCDVAPGDGSECSQRQ